MTEMTHPGEERRFVHKRFIRAAGGFLGGGIGGAARGFFAADRVPRPRSRSISRAMPSFRQRPAPRPPTRRAPVRRGFIETRLPFLSTRGSGSAPAAPAAGSGCPQGFHPNKSDYFTKAGFVAEGTKCVKNRRRNLSNGRANTKALRRMAAWDKQERKLGKTMKAIARGR